MPPPRNAAEAFGEKPSDKKPPQKERVKHEFELEYSDDAVKEIHDKGMEFTKEHNISPKYFDAFVLDVHGKQVRVTDKKVHIARHCNVDTKHEINVHHTTSLHSSSSEDDTPQILSQLIEP